VILGDGIGRSGKQVWDGHILAQAGVRVKAKKQGDFR
jgi:hypothetical protein